MKDARLAAERLADAIQTKESIAVYGDYDVDGVTSSSLLVDFVRAHGHDARVYIPKRLVEGYGLNSEAVEEIASWGAKLLITVDCGITAADEIAHGNTLGIQTIVVDHHHCPPALPPAFATLNPQQEDCDYPDKGLAAVGVCLNLLIATRVVLRERGVYEGGAEPNLRERLDLVALGTVADLVPLTGVNRILTAVGLRQLRATPRRGLRALMREAGVDRPRALSSDIGFRLGPRVNAAGRLDDATLGVRLMLTEDMKEARYLAESLNSANDSRKRIQEEVYREAVKIVDAAPLPEAIVLSNPDWHPGVVGIVCSKLVERYDRPTLLIGDGGRGSARSARGLHLYNAMADCADYLTKFGGHAAAAGFRIAADKVDGFRAALNARVKAAQLDEDAVPELYYDFELEDPRELHWPLFQELTTLRPFGMKNPEPTLMLRGVELRGKKLVAGEHLKLRLRAGRFGSFWAMLFGGGEREEEFRVGEPVSVVGYLNENFYQGTSSLELRLRDARAGA